MMLASLVLMGVTLLLGWQAGIAATALVAVYLMMRDTPPKIGG
jgi:hypothetical protein